MPYATQQLLLVSAPALALALLLAVAALVSLARRIRRGPPQSDEALSGRIWSPSEDSPEQFR